ncbi:hypothetical protein [uncultured Mucilaginibacter sp.]|uniref:hypothetical protein n=1 Tax=uncultured Mucilaginibacter sp. TaxID=797541 RepID=UPI00260BE6F6|nr:hypothetical protein [uncultured Mucilaginibacter sp.]
MAWNIAVIAISVLLLAFLLWKEIGRKNKAHLIWRLAASVLAVVSLVCLAIPPFYHGKRSINTNQEIVLLTEGFNQDSLNKYQSFAPVFTAEPAIYQTLKSSKIRFLTDLDLNESASLRNKTLHILGFGLKEDELKELQNFPISFNPNELPAGIQKINWTNRLKAGESFRVQGNFLNKSNGEIKLILKGLNTSLDSIKIGAKRSMSFSFQTIPKESGRAVFELLVLAGKDTVENEALPLAIEPQEKLKVLMLSAAPDFESRFLKNWLAENAYEVAARSTISKNKNTTGFANLEKFPLEKITSSLLQKFDVLVTDAIEFGNLSKPETSAILTQVNAKGMGLIIRADSVNNASFIGKNFALYQPNNPPKELHLKLNDVVGTRLKIQSEHPAFIRNQPNTQNLVQDEAAHVLVSSKLYGSGKLVLSTLNNTFSWQLSGKQKDYSAFWSELLSKAAQKTSRKENVYTEIYADKNSMTKVYLETADRNLTLKVNGQTLLLSQNPSIPFLQEATFWPERSGWFPISTQNNTTDWVYIFENMSWKTVKAAEKIRRTRQYARQFSAKQQNSQHQQKEELVFVPPLWFYLLFLLSCTFLWVETKLL